MVHIIINGQGFIIFFRQISTDFNKLTLLLKIQLVIMWTSVSVFKDFRWITYNFINLPWRQLNLFSTSFSVKGI